MSQLVRYFDGTILPDIETLTGDAGGAVGPDGAFNIDIFGGNNITTTGNPGANSITIAVTGTTDNTVQIGNATGSLTSLAAATDGQLVIGSTGLAPAVAALTAGTGITITNGAGTIAVATVADGFEMATVATVDATADVALFTLTLGADESATIYAIITGAVSDHSAALVGTVSGGARKDGAGAAVLIGSPVANFSEDIAGAPDIDIVVSGNDVIVAVTGVAVTTINWRAQIQFVLQIV